MLHVSVLSPPLTMMLGRIVSRAKVALAPVKTEAQALKFVTSAAQGLMRAPVSTRFCEMAVWPVCLELPLVAYAKTGAVDHKHASRMEMPLVHVNVQCPFSRIPRGMH